MKNLKETFVDVGRELLRTSALVYIPTSGRTKKRIVSDLQRQSDEIISLINDKTKISMSQVSVKTYTERMGDLVNVIKMTNPDFSRLSYALFYPFGKGMSMLFEDLQCMSYEPRGRVVNPSIYVCFGWANKIGREFDNPDKLKRNLVHELSHHLWFTIGGDQALKDWNSEKFKEYKVWSEGFATYCENKIFWDIYSDSPPNSLNGRGPVYEAGIRAIEATIKQAGENILFEIPLRWKEFRRLNNH